jgi:predicted phosphate transport protein (TIGR00153 family)
MSSTARRSNPHVHPFVQGPIVRIKFRPADDTFYEFFIQAANNLVRGTDLLGELALPGANVQSISERLGEVEHDSDQITHDVFSKINSTFVTPFDREDIYRLASNLDDVMDLMEEAVDSILLFQLKVLPEGVAEQIEVLQRAAALTAEAMPRLRTMKDLAEYWIEINRLENTGDQVHRRIIAELFNGETDALTVMKVKAVVDALEAAIDAFEHVANTVEQIAVKEG